MAAIVFTKKHLCHDFARIRLHVNRLPVDSIASLQWVSGIRVDRLVVVDDYHVSEFFPRELALTQTNGVTCKGNATG